MSLAPSHLRGRGLLTSLGGTVCLKCSTSPNAVSRNIKPGGRPGQEAEPAFLIMVGTRATSSVPDLMNLKARWSPGCRSWVPSVAMTVTVRPLNRVAGLLRLRPVLRGTRRVRQPRWWRPTLRILNDVRW